MTPLLAMVALAAPAMLGATDKPSPMPAADALALFRRVCAGSWPDPARFAAAIAAEPERFRKQQVVPGVASGPGGRYLSDRAEVDYSAADDVPRPLPSRQCGVLTRSEGEVDHAALAATMAAALSLPAGTTQTAKTTLGRMRMATQWTVSGSTADVRYLLITRLEPNSGSYNSMSMQSVRSTR